MIDILRRVMIDTKNIRKDRTKDGNSTAHTHAY